jgi:hypothetical protein
MMPSTSLWQFAVFGVPPPSGVGVGVLVLVLVVVPFGRLRSPGGSSESGISPGDARRF